MFPDLLRDDVFRLETRRLWLRWPRATDAAAIATLASVREVAESTACIPHPYPEGAAAAFILTSRAKNLEGNSLSLVICPKSRPDDAIGCVELRGVAPGEAEIGYWLGRPYWGKGLATEAVCALLAMSRRVSVVEAIHASVHPGNAASRRVLEKCGFRVNGEKLVAAPARGGSILADRFVWMGEPARVAPRVGIGKICA